MTTYSLSEARANLAELLSRAENGEDVTITRHGRPVAAVVGHDHWMKQKRLDVLERARELRADLEAARDKPLPKFPINSNYDYEAHITEIREGRDTWGKRDPRGED